MNVRRSLTAIAATLVLGIFLVGCQVPAPQATRSLDFQPDKTYRGGKTPLPKKDLEEKGLEVADNLLDLFKSEPLRVATQEALKNNQDLKRTAAVLDEAGFNTKKARSNRLPKFSAGFLGQRSAGSSGGGGGGGTTAAASSGGGESNFFDASLDASWEVDVWGKIRSQIAAQRFDESQLTADLEAAKQSVAAQTMQAWFDLVTAKKILEVAEKELVSTTATQVGIKERFETGIGDLGDFDLARTDTEQARADFERQKGEVEKAARALEVLLGRYPGADFKTGTDLPTLKKQVPAGLPSTLLTRRPDIVSAFAAVQAADSRTTVAQRDMFPSFTITTSVGSQSTVFEELFKNGLNAWSLAGQVTGPVFEFGARRAEMGAAGKRAEQAFHNYGQTVLTAFREVEDGLSQEIFLAREERAILAALDAAKRSEETTREDYDKGLVEVLSLLETQRRVFSTEERAITVRNSRLKNRVSLALALGKGV